MLLRMLISHFSVLTIRSTLIVMWRYGMKIVEKGSWSNNLRHNFEKFVIDEYMKG